jgi:hypothetical protein
LGPQQISVLLTQVGNSRSGMPNNNCYQPVDAAEPYSALHMSPESLQKNLLFVQTKQRPKTAISIDGNSAQVAVRVKHIKNGTWRSPISTTFSVPAICNLYCLKSRTFCSSTDVMVYRKCQKYPFSSIVWQINNSFFRVVFRAHMQSTVMEGGHTKSEQRKSELCT